MIVHGAETVNSAGSWTRILTLLANASLISGTICVDHALWATIRWRTDVIRQAGARWGTVNVTALGVGSAW